MEALENHVRVGKAVSDPTRLKILAALSVKDLCVCELVHLLGLGQPAVSRHLGILKDAGLLVDLRDGKFVNYRLRRPAKSTYAETVLAAFLESQDREEDFVEFRGRAAVVDRDRI